MATFLRFDEFVKSSLGVAVPGAQIFVCNQPANLPGTLGNSTPTPTPLASIFSDVNGLVPIVQPIITDGFGHADCYIASGTYTVIVYLNGILQQVYPDQAPMGAAISSSGGAGVVSSIGLVDNSGGIFSITGSPVTSSGNIGLAFGSQASNTALMGPVSGVAAAPTFRLLVANDYVTMIGDSGSGGTKGAVPAPPSGSAAANKFLKADATWALASPTFATAGQAGFWGPGFLGAPVGSTFNSSSQINNANNEVRVLQFAIAYTQTISRVSYDSLGSVNGTLFSFGIYSADGNTKLVDSGVFTLTGGGSLQTNTITPVTLNAGTYFLAQTANSASGVSGNNITMGANQLATYNKNAARAGTAANPSIGGVLPATLGTITKDNVNSFCAVVYFEP